VSRPRTILRRIPALATLCFACAAPIGTEPTAGLPIPPLFAPVDVALDSDALAFDGAVEVRASSRARWHPVNDSALSLALDIGTAHGRRHWTGFLAAARWSGRGTQQPWADLGAGAGTGDGARRAFQAAVGAEDRNVAFSLRAVHWEASPRQLTLSETVDTVGPPHSGGYADGEVIGRLAAGRLQFFLLGGLRVSDLGSTSPWASTEVGVPLGGRIELRAGGGTRPYRPERGEYAGAFVSLGIAVRPAAPRPAAEPVRRPPGTGPLEASPLADGGWTVAIRMPDAQSVEINGDITEWSPVRLLQSPDDPSIWTTRLTADAGVYLVAMRIDGGDWRAPPGLPVVPDGFGGQAGLLELFNR
jgi:hypothetical protein